jgi:hypothetical protein
LVKILAIKQRYEETVKHLALNWPAISIMLLMSTWYLIPAVIFIAARRKSSNPSKNEPIE